jgi:hypothetical protein
VGLIISPFLFIEGNMAKVVKITNGIPTYAELAASAYEGVYNVVGTITTGTPITLPSSGTYTDSDLSVYLNGQRMTYVEDFVYVGSPPRTQISMLFDLISGDILTFRREV